MNSDRKLRALNNAGGNGNNIGNMTPANNSHNNHGNPNSGNNSNNNSSNNSSNNSTNSTNNSANYNHNQHYNANGNNRARVNAGVRYNNTNEQQYVAINGFNGDALQNLLGSRFKTIEQDHANCIYKGNSVVKGVIGGGNNQKKKSGMDLLSELNRSFK